MSAIIPPEDPVDTIMRLVENRIRITKENGAQAIVKCSYENYDRELLKNADAQITFGLERSDDQKLDLTGRLRRKLFFIRCTGVALEKLDPTADPPRLMRSKLQEQLNAIIRENRTLPYQTSYNFAGLGYPSGDPHKAYLGAEASELAPSSTAWAEMSAVQYQNIWYSDDVRQEKSHTAAGEYGMQLFRFKIGPAKRHIKQIVISFEGYGIAPAGNGATVKVYNSTTSNWTNPSTGTGATDETLTITLTSSCSDYIDAEGYLWILARTTNPSDGAIASIIYCDYVQCIVQVQGLVNCDVVGHVERDEVKIKPFLFKTVFTLRGYYFQTISG